MVEPATLKFRFDLDTLKDHSQTNWGLNPEAAEFDLAIYQWQADINAWKRLPSEVLRDNTGNLISEKFVTPPQAENASVQKLRTSYISVDPNLTPGGKMGSPFP